MNHRFSGHPAQRAINAVLAKSTPAAKVLDSVEKQDGLEPDEILDAVGSEFSGDDYTQRDIALKAANVVLVWAETADTDLDEGESLADRLFALIIGIAAENMDGEIGEDEMAILDVALASVADYLSEKGVSDEDVSALLDNWDSDAAMRIQELVAERLPDEDAADEEADEFAFGDGSDEAMLDAVYKKKIVIRKGRKMRVNKRVSGHVRLSAKQKIGVRKMLRKSHSAKAMVRRMKSVKLRKKMGL